MFIHQFLVLNKINNFKTFRTKIPAVRLSQFTLEVVQISPANTAYMYEWRCTVKVTFHKVVRQHNSGAVEDFILAYSAVYLRIQNWNNYWNRSIFAKVIVKMKVAHFMDHGVISCLSYSSYLCMYCSLCFWNRCHCLVKTQCGMLFWN